MDFKLCNQLECGKNSSEFFVKFKIFKYVKLHNNCFKKYIYTVIKIPNYFSQNISQMFQ
jgi:hypothetical protein